MPGGAPWKWDLSLVHLCNLALELWAWSMWYITMGYGMTGVGGKGEENEIKGEDKREKETKDERGRGKE